MFSRIFNIPFAFADAYLLIYNLNCWINYFKELLFCKSIQVCIFAQRMPIFVQADPAVKRMIISKYRIILNFTSPLSLKCCEVSFSLKMFGKMLHRVIYYDMRQNTKPQRQVLDLYCDTSYFEYSQ